MQGIKSRYTELYRSKNRVIEYTSDIEEISEQIKGAEDVRNYEIELQEVKSRLKEQNTKKDSAIRNESLAESDIANKQKLYDSLLAKNAKYVETMQYVRYAEEILTWLEETYNDKEWQLTTEERELLDNLFLALEVEEQLTKGEVKLQIVSTLEKTLVERHEHEKDLQDKGEFREKYWFRAEEEYVLTGKLIIKDCHNYSDYKTQYYKKDDEDFDFMAIKEE